MEAPELREYLAFTWNSFHELSYDRPIGSVPGPIPSGAIRVYAERHGLDPLTEAEFFLMIRAMDHAWMEYASELRQKAASEHASLSKSKK